jgi:hypothetical protein
VCGSSGRGFKIFAWGIFIASVGVYIRCIYRIAEQAGWKNKIMQDEISFCAGWSDGLCGYS